MTTSQREEQNWPLLQQDERPHHSEKAQKPEGAPAPRQNLQIEAATEHQETLLQDVHARVIRRINWHLLPIFFSLATLCSIDRANLSFAALQLNYDLHFSDSVYGLGSGVFFIGYAAFAIPSTFVCASIGAPAFLGGILVIWGSIATLFSVMRKSWQFYLLRFFLGLAESGAYPGMWFHLALFYNDREMVLAYTVVSTASSLSGVIGAPIAASILQLDGFLDLRGWQWLFLLEGFPAILLGFFVFFYLAKTPAEASFLTQDERHWLCTREKQTEPRGAPPLAGEEQVLIGKQPEESPLNSLLQMLREWRIWYLASIWAIISVGMDTLNFWLPLLIKSIVYGEAPSEDSEDSDREVLKGQSVHTALLSSIPLTSAALGMVVVAYSSKKSGERSWHTALPLAVGSAAAVVTGAVGAQVQWLALVALTISAVGIWGPHGPLLTWPAALLDGSAAASGFALIKMVGALAAFGGNAAMGELHEETGSFALPMFLLAGLLALGALLALHFKAPGHDRAVDTKRLLGRIFQGRDLKRSRSDPISTSVQGPNHRLHYGDAGHQVFEMPSFRAQP